MTHLAMLNDTRPRWSTEDFEAKLRDKGTSYHIYHPFHVMMAEGKLTQKQLQGWVANRFYYQIAIPVKDAAIMANCPDREIRREWIQRILDHDGYEIGGAKDAGGIEAWIRLGETSSARIDREISMVMTTVARSRGTGETACGCA